jgi:hypothetical protein
MHRIFWLKNPKGRDYSEDLGVDGKIILDWVLGKIGWDGVDWMHLAQDRDQWRVLVNTVMNLQVPLKAGNFLTI